MPPASPRRSSRARPNQGPPSAPSHANSMSSNSSSRADRNTRSTNKQSSPQKSATPQSLTSEDASEQARAGTSEQLQTRRSKRQQDQKEEVEQQEQAEEDEIIEDNEVTRCVCGKQDYPGPPLVDDDAEDDSEEGGLFIQCDSCSVWQHGGCVGIMNDTMTPEFYYCDECRPDYHKLFENDLGQRFSRYVPVVGSKLPKTLSRKLSKDSGKPGKKDKDSVRQSTERPGKRRSTMNSRSAYNEEEAYLIALEESKQDAVPVGENGGRRGKRARTESEEEPVQNIKRPRLDSMSDAGGDSNTELATSDAELGKGASTRKQAARGAAARNMREKELREREKERSEAATNRKRRADQRRADDSIDIDVSKANGKDGANNDPLCSVPPDTPSASGSLIDTNKKGKGGPGKRGRGRGADTPTERGESSPVRGKNGKASASPKDPQINGNGEASGTEINAATTNGVGKRGKAGKGDKEGKGNRDVKKELSWAEMRRGVEYRLQGYDEGAEYIRTSEWKVDVYRSAGASEQLMAKLLQKTEELKESYGVGKADAENWMKVYGNEKDRSSRGGAAAGASSGGASGPSVSVSAAA